MRTRTENLWKNLIRYLPFYLCGLLILTIGGCQGASTFLGRQPSTIALNLANANWPLEGGNLSRNRAIAEEIAPPLELLAELVIGGDTQFASPVSISEGLFFVEGTRKLHALSIDGEGVQEVWSINLPGSFLSPAVVDNRVFVRAESGEDGYIFALSAEAGAKLWEYKFPRVGSSYDNIGGHVTSPVTADGLLVVGAAHSLFALDVTSGDLIWQYQMDSPVASSVAVAGETVYVTDFRQLYAVDLETGREKWRFGYDTVTLFFAPVVIDKHVVVASFDMLYVLNREKGNVLWSRNFDEVQIIPAAATPEMLFVKSVNRLIALDAATGTSRWEYESINFVSLPAITKGHVYVVTRADGGSQLRALSLDEGTEVWRSSNRQISNAAPVATGGHVYIRTTDGRILVYGAAQLN